MTNRYAEITDQLTKWSILHRIFSHKMTENSPIYPGQVPILLYTSQHPGCTQQEIADKMGVSAASIAQSTKRLQKAGFVTKVTDEDNLRRNKITITAAGESALYTCLEQIDALDSQMFKNFTDDEIDQLQSYIHRLIINLEPDRWREYDLMDYLAMVNKMRDCDYADKKKGGNA